MLFIKSVVFGFYICVLSFYLLYLKFFGVVVNCLRKLFNELLKDEFLKWK